MDESLTGKQKFQLVLKEMKIGFSNGMILGTISFALVGLYIALFKGKTFLFAYAVSGCIGLSLVLAMVVSGAVGTCIPLFFKKIHVDPAVASRPADHNDQRPCRSCVLLRTELDSSDQYTAFGRLNSSRKKKRQLHSGSCLFFDERYHTILLCFEGIDKFSVL